MHILTEAISKMVTDTSITIAIKYVVAYGLLRLADLGLTLVHSKGQGQGQDHDISAVNISKNGNI